VGSFKAPIDQEAGVGAQGDPPRRQQTTPQAGRQAHEPLEFNDEAGERGQTPCVYQGSTKPQSRVTRSRDYEREDCEVER